MIPPYGLEVTFDKTVHIIFPASIKYVDLGSSNIIAGKAGPSENVLRVKATIRNFETETNMAVITEEGKNDTRRPKCSKAAIISNIPEKNPAIKTPLMPYLIDIASKIAVIAPVGPDI